MPITISGTLDEIHTTVRGMLAITTYRKHAGWTMFQDDELWDYETQKDERVCPVCWSFEHEWVGSEIPVEFITKWRTGQNVVYPNTHDNQDYTFLRGECRCSLIWRDYLEVLTARLFDELAEVA